MVRRRFGLLDTYYRPADELLRMRLLVEHVVGRYGAQHALEACRVWSVEEEFLPEAFRQFGIVVFFLNTLLARRCCVSFGDAP